MPTLPVTSSPLRALFPGGIRVRRRPVIGCHTAHNGLAGSSGGIAEPREESERVPRKVSPPAPKESKSHRNRGCPLMTGLFHSASEHSNHHAEERSS